MNISRDIHGEEKSCPFLGLADDPTTYLNFTSEWNHCHHSQPTAGVKYRHQESYCLSWRYPNCSVFQKDGKKEMPEELRFQKSRAPKRSPWKIGLLVASVLVVSLLIVWQVFSGNLDSFPWRSSIETGEEVPVISYVITVSETAALTHAAELPSTTPLLEPTPISSTPTVLPTNTPMPSATPAPPTPTIWTPESNDPHITEYTFGIDYQFMILQVQSGNSLEEFASKYATSTKAIQAVNYDFQLPLNIGTPLIIPVGILNLVDLPPFEAYPVIEEGKTVEMLALERDLDPQDLMYFNALPAGYLFSIGEWVLIPHFPLAHALDAPIGSEDKFMIRVVAP
jgi:hypothetical protein